MAVVAAGFRKKAAVNELARRRAAAEAVKPLAAVFVDTMEIVAPRDTNRYVRAWQLAANDAGLPPRAVLPVRSSSKRAEWIKALEGQVDYWARQADKWQRLMTLYEQYDAAHPTKKNGEPRKKRTATASYRRYRRLRDRAAREVKKADEILAEALASEGFLLFDKGGFAPGRAARFGKRKRFRTTIRAKVYGGEGSVMHIGPVTLVRLHNREPHASIVSRSARHGRPLTFALAAVRAFGGRPVRKAWTEALIRVTGFRRGRAG